MTRRRTHPDTRAYLDRRTAQGRTQAEITRQRAEQERLERERLEQERLERERIAREKAEAEARARREAAESAINEAKQLLAKGRNDDHSIVGSHIARLSCYGTVPPLTMMLDCSSV